MTSMDNIPMRVFIVFAPCTFTFFLDLFDINFDQHSSDAASVLCLVEVN